MTIYNLDELLSLFGTSLLFHVQFYLLLPDLLIGFSRGSVSLTNDDYTLARVRLISVNLRLIDFFQEPEAMGIQGKFVVVPILNSLQFCCDKYVCL